MTDSAKNNGHSIKGVGGKAKSLLHLRSAGFRVPYFCIIPYHLWNDSSSDPEAGWTSLQSLCHQLELAQDSFTVSVLAASLRARIHDTDIPQPVSKLVEGWTGEHAEKSHTFVRSSAASEDGSESSSAGQYESVLSTSDRVGVTRAVLTVTESYYSLRAVTYRQSRGITQTGPRMGLILQLAVPATASGIVFGCDPISGNREVVVVEACLGLGTAIVSGALTPDRFIVDKKTGRVLEHSLGSKIWQDLFDDRAAIERFPTTPEQKKKFSLREDQLKLLVSEYLRIESTFGPPQDVEWAYEGEILWLLQSRPVTAQPSTEKN